MPQNLTSSDIAILEGYNNAGDRIGYYDYLIGKGYAYAQLAKSVVLNQNVSGAFANVYLERSAQYYGVSGLLGFYGDNAVEKVEFSFPGTLPAASWYPITITIPKASKEDIRNLFLSLKAESISMWQPARR